MRTYYAYADFAIYTLHPFWLNANARFCAITKNDVLNGGASC